MNFRFLSLMIIVTFVGCLAEPIIVAGSNSATNSLDESPSALELKALISQSEMNLSTYRYMIITTDQINVTSTNPANLSNLMMISTEKGVVNLTGKTLSRNRKSNQIINGNNNTSIDNEIYVQNDTLTTKLENKWTQKKLQNAEDVMHSQNIIKDQSEFLNNSKIDLLGFEKVDGQECYLVRVKPDRKTFATILSGVVDSRSSLTPNDLEKLYNTSTFTCNSWVTKDSHFLKKNDIKMMLTLTPDSLGMNARTADEQIVRINYSSIALFSDFNQNVSITLSNEFKSAYPFPLQGGNGASSATVFGVVRDDDTRGYGNDAQKILFDMTATRRVTAHLVDTDDRFYGVDGGYNDLDANERGFLVFEIPIGIIIKKIRFEPNDNYGYDGGAPFSIDMRLDRLGSTIGSSKDVGGQIISKGEISIDIYNISQKDGYSSSRSSHLVDLSIDLKVTNNGATGLSLNSKDFSLVDQYGWEYAASDESGYNQLGTLLSGESRRFNVAVDDVSELSELETLKYKDVTMHLNR
jgi:hypothetical protein